MNPETRLIRVYCLEWTRLVFDTDLDLLFGRRDDLVLIGSLECRKSIHCVGDDLERFLDLFLRDDEWRGQTDDVLVGGFGLERALASDGLPARGRNTYQQTLLLEQHAEVPCAVTTRLGFVDDDGVEKTLTAHLLDHGVLDCLQSLPEDMTQRFRLLHHVLLPNDLQGPDGDRASQWVAAIGRPVRTGFDGEHDVLATQHAGHGVHATGDGLAQEDHVRLDATPFIAEELARAGNPRLDLIADQQRIVLVTQGPSLLEVILVRHNDARLSLDGLDQESRDVGARLLEGFAQRRLVVVCDGLVGSGNVAANAGQVGTVVLTGLGVGGEGDGGELDKTYQVSDLIPLTSNHDNAMIINGTYRATMEIVLGTEHHRLVLGNTLDLVPPLARDLDTRLNRLGSRVHGQDHVESEELGDKLGKPWENIIIKGARTKGDTRGLIDESRQQLRVTVTLVDGGIGGQEVEVVTALGVPHRAPLCPRDHHREGMVVVRRIVLLHLDGLLRGWHMVSTEVMGVAVGRPVGILGRHDG